MSYDRDFFEQKFADYSEKEGTSWGINWRASQIRRHKIMKNIIEQFLVNKKGAAVSSVLEIGCATGDFIPYYYPLCSTKCKVVCYDLSSNAIDVCKKRFSKLKIIFKQGSVLELYEADCSFDMVICMEVLHYLGLKELSNALNEIRRIMSEKGCAILTFPLSEDDMWGKAYYDNVSSVFETVETQYIDNWFYQKYLEPILLFFYRGLNTKRFNLSFLSGVNKILRKMLQSEIILEGWIRIGSFLKCRKNSHIVMIVRK